MRHMSNNDLYIGSKKDENSGAGLSGFITQRQPTARLPASIQVAVMDGRSIQPIDLWTAWAGQLRGVQSETGYRGRTKAGAQRVVWKRQRSSGKPLMKHTPGILRKGVIPDELA